MILCVNKHNWLKQLNSWLLIGQKHYFPDFYTKKRHFNPELSIYGKNDCISIVLGYSESIRMWGNMKYFTTKVARSLASQISHLMADRVNS